MVCDEGNFGWLQLSEFFSWLKTQAKFSLHARETKSRIEGGHEDEQIEKLQEGFRGYFVSPFVNRTSVSRGGVVVQMAPSNRYPLFLCGV